MIDKNKEEEEEEEEEEKEEKEEEEEEEEERKRKGRKRAVSFDGRLRQSLASAVSTCSAALPAICAFIATSFSFICD
jgi:hypothetical protein